VKVAEKPNKTLAKVRAELRRDRDLIERVQERITANLKLGVELGGSAPDLAADAGYHVSRVTQLVGGVRKVRAAAGVQAPKRKPPTKKVTDEEPASGAGDAAPAESEPAAELPVSVPERYQPGAASRVRQLLAHDGRNGLVVSDRYAPDRSERPTIFVEVDTGEWWATDIYDDDRGSGIPHGHIPWREGSAAELLAALESDGPLSTVERVFFVGSHRPGVTPERARRYGSAADAARTWYMADVEGWTAAGHYLADDVALVGRWERNGRTVEVQRGATWFGEGVYTPRDAAMAWHVLRGEVARTFPGGMLMSTPATTGRDLWRRGIPAKGGFPVLSTELRELIQSTSGQGRRELVARPANVGRLPLVTQYDMRLAYAALAWGMPVGAPTMVTGRAWEAMADEDQAVMLKRRGRWLVRATVPTGWDRVGILPTPSPDGTWAWPSTPGHTFASWCSASELAVARLHGWRCQIVEGFHFDEGKPLNTWKDKLVAIYEAKRQDVPPVVSKMVSSAARMMILSTVGAFASRTHAVTRSVPVASVGHPAVDLPEDVPIREVGGMYVWEERGERSAWMERVSHPEWSAEIWGRCRARLLSAVTGTPGVTAGALHVPPGSVIGMRTDGITLAGDPGWPDDGKPGRYRLKGRMRGAFEWPETDAALSELKRQAEGAFETGEMQ
jgi:hypothetical protein